MENSNFTFAGLTVVVALFIAPPVCRAEITPTDVFKAVAELRSDMMLIREKIGARSSDQAELDVTGASPREVLAQAKSLQQKSAQLFREITSKPSDTLILIPDGKVMPAHVIKAVKNAHGYVMETKNALGISKVSFLSQFKAEYAPTDVYKSIIQANRQLNLMLQKKVAPTDVYRRVQDSIDHVYILRQQFPGASIPTQEPLIVGKKPGDVYNRLVKLHNIQWKIMSVSGIKALTLGEAVKASSRTTPGDVYDVASLMLSEVKDTYLTMNSQKITPGVYWPGDKEPHHVYQLVGKLEIQLNELLALVEEDPDWLKR